MRALFLVAPLVLHTTTAIISATGARRGRLWYGIGLGVASLIHVAYNLAVVSIIA